MQWQAAILHGHSYLQVKCPAQNPVVPTQQSFATATPYFQIVQRNPIKMSPAHLCPYHSALSKSCLPILIKLKHLNGLQSGRPCFLRLHHHLTYFPEHHMNPPSLKLAFSDLQRLSELIVYQRVERVVFHQTEQGTDYQKTKDTVKPLPTCFSAQQRPAILIHLQYLLAQQHDHDHHSMFNGTVELNIFQGYEEPQTSLCG